MQKVYLLWKSRGHIRAVRTSTGSKCTISKQHCTRHQDKIRRSAVIKLASFGITYCFSQNSLNYKPLLFKKEWRTTGKKMGSFLSYRKKEWGLSAIRVWKLRRRNIISITLGTLKPNFSSPVFLWNTVSPKSWATVQK